MFTSSGKRVKQGPKAAAQRKLGLAARISYAIGGIIALLWLVYFLIPYSKNLEDVGLPDSVTELKEKANSLDIELEVAKRFPFPEKPELFSAGKSVKKIPESVKKNLIDLSRLSPDDIRKIRGFAIEWEQQTGKDFLLEHPSMKIIQSRNVLHSTDNRESIIHDLDLLFSNPGDFKSKDYYPPLITLLDIVRSGSFRDNIIGHIDYVEEEGKTKTITLPDGVCAFAAPDMSLVKYPKYGRVSLVECGKAWKLFFFVVYYLEDDSHFLGIHPSYYFGAKYNNNLIRAHHKNEVKEIKRKRQEWIKNAEYKLEEGNKKVSELKDEAAEFYGFRIFGYFIFFLSIICFFIINKPYGFINLPNGAIKPKTLKYILGASVYFGLIFSFGVTKEMADNQIFFHSDTPMKVIFSSLLVFFGLLLFFPAFYGAIEWIKETETYRKLFVYGKGGSARWGSIRTYMKYDFSDYMKQLRAGKFRQEKSAPIYCGRTAWRNDLMLGCRDIGLSGNSHMLTISTSGGGKSLYVSWNELLSWPGGAFIFDPKGEHAERTFHVRKQHMDCYALDPSGAINKNANIPLASYNPFDEIDIKNDSAGADLREIIRASVYEEKSESTNSKYFRDKAIEIALGYSVHLLTKYPKNYHNLPSMFDLFLMGSPDGVGVDENALKKLHAEMMVNEAVGSAAMIAAKTLKDAGEKGELGGIKNSFSTAFQWVKDEAITRTLKSSSFSMKDIRKKDASLYVCVRLDNLKDEHYVRWFRTISTMALQATREQINSRYKTLFLFDEFYHLGTFEPVARGLTTLRGQNVKLHLFFQNIGQIKTLYKNSGDFFSSCDKQFFGVTENETAEEISKQLGKYIEKWPEGSEDHPRYNERERILRPPSEILGQLAKGKTEQYIIPTNGFPMELELVPFYKNFDEYGEVYNKEITDG